MAVKQSLNTLPAGTFALAFYWTADGSGAVTATLANQLPEVAQGMRILQCETVPGTPTPTNGYSVALKNSFGTDLMAGAMATVSNSANQLWSASSATPPFVGAFTLVITGNAVANAQGIVIVYFSATQLINSNAGSPGPAGPPGPQGPAGDASGAIITSDYNFAPIAPGGSLTIGANTIVLNPLPPGINALSVNTSYLYIKNGTGSPEAVPIIGVSGFNVTIVCANTHTGPWTTESATEGVQEAVNATFASTSTASLRIPGGNFTFNAGVSIPSGVNISLRGLGIGATQIQAGTVDQIQTVTQKLFNFIPGSAVDFGDMTVSSTAYRPNAVGLWIEGVGDGLVSNLKISGQNLSILSRSCARVTFTNIVASGGTNSMQFDASTTGAFQFPNTSTVSNVHIIANAGGTGVFFGPTCAGMAVDNLFVEDGSYSVQLSDSLQVGPIDEIQFSNCIFDSYTIGGFKINLANAISACTRVSLRNCILGSVSGVTADSYGVSATSNSLGQIQFLSLQNLEIDWFTNANAHSGAGIFIGGTESLSINGVVCRSGDTFGSGIEFTAPGSKGTIISGSRLGVDANGLTTGAGIAQRGVLIGAEAHSQMLVDGNVIAGSVASVTNSSTDLTTVEFTNTNRVLPAPAIASAAALPIPAFPNFTITGTTGVTSVTGLDAAHAGRSGSFVTPGAVPFTSGATIGNSFTTTASELYSWYWDGTKIWIAGKGV